MIAVLTVLGFFLKVQNWQKQRIWMFKAIFKGNKLRSRSYRTGLQQ